MVQESLGSEDQEDQKSTKIDGVDGSPVVAGVVELLVRISVRAAVPDLEFCAVRIDTVFDVKTLGVAKEFDATARESPLLRVSTGARLNCDDRAIGVGLRGKAFTGVVTRFEQDRREVRGGLCGGRENVRK